ncbi:MAG: hypothetical protein EOS36_20985 [Mesorhizobium sp.]|nr:MAG: hypothetical protein EOS36_20985 [Mesorhizobium sp.]RWE42120.1 MAG: hypothetical protein EOS79_16685 [Mesorhizobium sp.]
MGRPGGVRDRARRHQQGHGRGAGGASLTARAIPGKVCNGFPSGIAQKQILRAVRRFYESLKRSRRSAPET